MFEMKEAYLTGIESIDEEHRKLFEIAGRAYELLHQDFIPDKYDQIIGVINELKEYTVIHFANEEAYMESIGYKKMFTQKMQHAQFIQKVNEIDFTSIDENQEQAIADILNFLTDWFVEHILENDILIGKS